MGTKDNNRISGDGINIRAGFRLKKIDEIIDEVESQKVLLMEMAEHYDDVFNFMRAYCLLEDVLQNGGDVSPSVEDKVVSQWNSVIKNKVNECLH